jgi:hypothetical protein
VLHQFIAIAQLAFWVRTKRGKQRVASQKWLTELAEAMHGRILGFNVSVAHVKVDTIARSSKR